MGKQAAGEVDKRHFYMTILLYSLVITAFAQFRLDILIQYFSVSLGIVLIPLLFIIIDGFPLMPVAVLSGFMVSLSRMLVDYTAGNPVGLFSTAYLPETFFYIIYAFLLSIYCDGVKRKLDRLVDIIPLTFIDYVANMMELVLRQGVQSYTFENQMGIVFVGLFRSIIVFAVIWLFRSYRVMLMKHEDVKLYRQLLDTASQLSGETVWMRENMQLVENTMNDAYKLYNGLAASGNPEQAQKALRVATNVHEIKKQYVSISDGLQAALLENQNEKDMTVPVIAKILLVKLRQAADARGVHLTYTVDCPENIATEKYYYMMSLLNNLFTNALEAARGDHLKISFKTMQQDDVYRFIVTNDGKQIPKEELLDIWNPGYSTKIDYESGVVGRGLGLIVVKDIVEKEFGGTIEAHSDAAETSFVFQIPCDRLEVKK